MGNPETLTVSMAFHPDSNFLPHRPNAVLVSCDSVIFYAHIDVLSTVSGNFFGSLLSVDLAGYTEHRPLILTTTEHSHVLNVILHTIYNMSSATFEPSMATLISAVACLVKYGIPLQVYIAPGTPLYALLVAHAPHSPLDVYALAGQCDLYDLAVQASPFLLAYRPTMISEEYAERMGPIYYRRLVSLQTSRVEALKEILRDPPRGHPETANCDAGNQAGLGRAWELTAAYLIWERRPGACVHIPSWLTFTRVTM